MQRIVWNMIVAAISGTVVYTASGAIGRSAGTGESFRGPLGLQLFSLRNQFAKDVPGTLDEIVKLGFKNVELAGTYNMPPEKFSAELSSRGLRAVSGHYPYEKFRDDLEGIIREAKIFKFEYVGCAWIPHEGKFDEPTCRQAIQLFNKVSESLAKQHIKFFYHTHGFEFQPHGNDTLFDVLVNGTKPGLVNYEMDVFWVVYGGADPVQLLRKYGNRFQLMHLKGMKDNTPTGLSAPQVDGTSDVPLGMGKIDYQPVLRAAMDAKVSWYFIEDESPTSEQQIPQSLRYLERVSW